MVQEDDFRHWLPIFVDCPSLGITGFSIEVKNPLVNSFFAPGFRLFFRS